MPNENYAYVYILSNSFRKLYIGVTTDLMVRISQHKRRTNPGCHTAKYGIDELVYFERFTSILAAIRREKVLKGWLRIRKLELIIKSNPLWEDLSAGWGKPIASLAPKQNAGVLHCVQDDGEELSEDDPSA